MTGIDATSSHGASRTKVPDPATDARNDRPDDGGVATAPATTARSLAESRTSAEALGAEPTTAETLGGGRAAALSADESGPSVGDAVPLAGAVGMAARREFVGAPLDPGRAYTAYRHLAADDLAGPDDMRLAQLQRSVGARNAIRLEALDTALGGDPAPYGRAKTPFSTFGKLRETSGSTIGDIRDLSGMRVDVAPTRPGFADVYSAHSRMGEAFGDGFAVKRDYIREPNDWGYTGRVHGVLTEADGLTHEI